MSLLSCSSFDLYCILSYYCFAMIELIKMDGCIQTQGGAGKTMCNIHAPFSPMLIVCLYLAYLKQTIKINGVVECRWCMKKSRSTISGFGIDHCWIVTCDQHLKGPIQQRPGHIRTIIQNFTAVGALSPRYMSPDKKTHSSSNKTHRYILEVRLPDSDARDASVICLRPNVAFFAM